eukprot:763085-Amphidinium_carterae.1
MDSRSTNSNMEVSTEVHHEELKDNGSPKPPIPKSMSKRLNNGMPNETSIVLARAALPIGMLKEGAKSIRAARGSVPSARRRNLTC